MDKKSEERTKGAEKAGEVFPEKLESLVQWRFTEEKKVRSADKELLIAIVGITAAILAIIAKTYIFSVLLLVATTTLVFTHRKEPKKMLFNITNIGLFLDDDFVELACIKGFNIINDPGDRARLILKVERVVHMNEILPIYDVNIEDIEGAFTRLGVPKEETLGPTVLDYLTSVII